MLTSIFNDVIGPIMRGPSSSHCAAALRIGRLARDFMEGELSEVLIEFDRHGSLATTHESQGSDMGLCAGLLGWDADDERLPNAPRVLQESGVRVHVELIDADDPHPNTYRLTLRNASCEHAMIAVSTGGGMIEIIEIDNCQVSIAGDYRETLIRPRGDGRDLAGRICELFEADKIMLHVCDSDQLINVKARDFVDEAILEELEGEGRIQSLHRLEPVLPVLSRKKMSVPFSTCEEMLQYRADEHLPLWKLAVEYESMRGDLSEPEVLSRMLNIVRISRRSIEQGIAGTQYEDRILGSQSGGFQSRMESGGLLEAGALNRVILYVTALMEVKSSMGVIVASPTAGSCGTLPGACIAVADEMDLSEESIAKAMLVAGLIGVFIATRSTFAAESAGCQAECGAASCMAAAALTTLADGDTAMALAAASMALQNSLGMVCDPVANRVEVPCLGKNVMAASNALSCANMALAGFDPVVPLDEVIDAADRVGRSLPRELRCTALGGLSITPTSKKIEKKLADAGT